MALYNVYMAFNSSVIYSAMRSASRLATPDRLPPCHLSAPFQPFHALNECAGVRPAATTSRAPPRTRHPEREPTHHTRKREHRPEPPRNRGRADNERSQTRTADTNGNKIYTFVNLFTILQEPKMQLFAFFIIYLYYIYFILLYHSEFLYICIIWLFYLYLFIVLLYSDLF